MKILRRRSKGRIRKPIFLSRKWKRRRKVWRGLFWLALLGLAALPSVHWANLLLYQKQLQTTQPFLLPLPLNKLGDRVVVVSPHPDDETLGCAGLIQRLLQRGAEPVVIVVTNGDGFDASIHLKLHEVQIEPEDRATYVKMRQAETLAAMRKLGLFPEQVIFLDFSERTLAADWLRNGDESFVNELANWFEKIRPTTVILPSRYDDHPIHAVVCSLGWAALLKLAAEGRLTYMPKVLEFLIHYGEFPRPQGLQPSLELLPPSDLILAARWYHLPLSSEMKQRKWEALKCYRTQQLPLTWRFLKSFVRTNELFSEPFLLTDQIDRRGEPRSLFAGLDITQIRLDLPNLAHLASGKHRPRNFSIKLRGKANSHFRYGVKVWQPNPHQRSTLMLKSGKEQTLTTKLSIPLSEPTVLVAFTAYGKHILDVAPMVLMDGVENGSH
ncbi:MAG: PIG-L family deacetylase [Armatimonadetes bacterium]|nr:PIG-L family deacetylase [Armatimonadota bacterium]MCX7966968.1 PIG-L family deacetylase [Armatimonadota bacterium]MDW8142124.1 PIG-L family deacetylase [Armatimonadota bacterium]